MNRLKIKEDLSEPSLLETTNTYVMALHRPINDDISLLVIQAESKRKGGKHQRKLVCFKGIVSLASSVFTTNTAREEWKAFIVSLYLTQWLLNGFKPINQAVARNIAPGSVTNFHKRRDPSAQQSLHTHRFSNAMQTRAPSLKTCGFSLGCVHMTEALTHHWSTAVTIDEHTALFSFF